MPRPKKSRVPDPKEQKKAAQAEPISIEDQIRFTNKRPTFVQGGKTRLGIVQ